MGSRTHAALALGALVLVLASGCYRTTYVTGMGMGGPVAQERVNFFLFGIIGEADVDVQELCPDGVGWMQNRMSFVDLLLGLVTLNLYAPRTVELHCSKGTAFLLTPDPVLGVTWVERSEGGDA